MTLEQLIEACGERFDDLCLVDPKSTDWKWYVGYKTPDNDYDRFYGSTPTEAVQNLYDYLKENNLLNNN